MKEIFINKANKRFNFKYDYSLVDYLNSKTLVKILCPEHGVFEQTPCNHLRTTGCPQCSNNYKYTTESFIIKAIKIHGDKYDYSKVVYVNNMTKITIICKEHGEFEQTPLAHLNNKAGCPVCVGRNKTNEERVLDAKKIHGDKYDYSLFKYTRSKDKVIIICKEHGSFSVSYDNHIRKGYGCPKCNKSFGEKNIIDFLVYNNILYETQKTFVGCIYKQKLKFDFYLPEYNICIEYDGEQHFKKYGFENNNDSLNIRKKRDSIKDNYCLENNILLYRINFKDDIKYKLEKILEDVNTV